MRHVIITLWILLLVLSFSGQAQTSFNVVIPGNPPGGIGGACGAATYAYLMPLTGGSQMATCSPSTHLWVAGGGGSGASPAGSAVTDAQCWASASTFGACANINSNLTGTVTGHASLDLPLTGGALSGDLNTKNVNAVATQGAEQAPALTNGNWTVGSGWESPIVGPGLIKNANGTGTQTPSAATSIVAGTTYKVVITVSAMSVSSATYTLGGTPGTSLTAATTYTDYLIARSTGKLIITPANTSRFTISAISIIPLTAATADLTVDGALSFRSLFGGATTTQSDTVYGLPYINSTGQFVTDPLSGYVACSGSTCSAGGTLYLGQITSGTGPASAGIVIGNSAVGGGQLELKNFAGVPRIFTRGSADLLICSNAVGLFCEINGLSGIKLNPAAGTNVAISAHTVYTGTTPTITSGGGGTGALPAGVDQVGKVTVGTSVATGAIVIALSYAYPHTAHCDSTDETNSATIVSVCTFTGTQQITLTGYSRTTGLAANFTASDVVSWGIPGTY